MFTIKNKVFLNKKYFNLKKLNKLYIKLFRIIKNVRNISYKLDIPGKSKIFLVFYVFFLKRTFKGCETTTFQEYNNTRNIYKVKDILGKNKLKLKTKFLVK